MIPAAAEPAGQAQPFTLTNLGPGIITAVALSPAGQGRFGASLIGRVELPPGQSLHLTPPRDTACLNDLRIGWADGRAEERAGEDLCQPHRVLRIASPPS